MSEEVSEEGSEDRSGEGSEERTVGSLDEVVKGEGLWRV